MITKERIKEVAEESVELTIDDIVYKIIVAYDDDIFAEDETGDETTITYEELADAIKNGSEVKFFKLEEVKL